MEFLCFSSESEAEVLVLDDAISATFVAVYVDGICAVLRVTHLHVSNAWQKAKSITEALAFTFRLQWLA